MTSEEHVVFSSGRFVDEVVFAVDSLIGWWEDGCFWL